MSRARVSRINPTLVRMECPCRLHGRHVVFLSSSDDMALLLAQWIARLRSDEGWALESERDAPDIDSVPF